MLAANYRSGDDFVVEFLGHRFEFSAGDFGERVTAAAVRLGLIGSNDLDEDEEADLVELVADGRIVDPRAGSASTSSATGSTSRSSRTSRSSTGCGSSSSAAPGSTTA